MLGTPPGGVSLNPDVVVDRDMSVGLLDSLSYRPGVIVFVTPIAQLSLINLW